MAKTRLITTNLVRTLDRIASPVYLVEVNSVVSYANQACLDWVGLKSTDLNGRQCRYTSQRLDEPVENRIRGLAPPPAFFSNGPIDSGDQRFSVFVETGDQKKEYRTAFANRLCDDAGTVVALLVNCTHAAQNDYVQPEASDLIAHSNQLHELLAHLRDQWNQKYSLQSVLGLNSNSIALQKKIDVAVQTDANVLIIGPPGSGREHLARVIAHQRRPESNPPIPVHCAIADPELIQRTIKENASSPSPRAGAPKCLLLLSVEELSELGQEELWGFVQLPGFSTRLLSTSSQPLGELVRQNEFHSGLAEYLNTISLELLPLAERAGDLPILAQTILEDINARGQKQLSGFSPSAMQLIQQFSWPRNIDQLEHAIRQAAEACTENQIALDDFPESLRLAIRAQEIGRPVETRIQLEDYLNQVESELILRAMQQAKDNKSKAAKLLGISRPKLLRRLRQLCGEADNGDDRSETDVVDSTAFKEAVDDD